MSTWTPWRRRSPDLERARTERTRAVLVVHLFGGRLDLAPIARFCRRHDLMLVEDSAQAFTGPDSLAPTGADVVAGQLRHDQDRLGGRRRAGGGDRRRAAVQHEQGAGRLAGPEPPRRTRASWPKPACSRSSTTRAGSPCCTGCAAGSASTWMRLINASTRSFATGDALPARIRRRPTPALLALLGRRLGRVDHDRLAARAVLRRGAEPPAAGGLPAPGRTGCTGVRTGSTRCSPRTRTRWSPRCGPRGIDVSRGTSNLVAVAAGDGSVPEQAGRLMSLDRLPAELSRAGRGRSGPADRRIARGCRRGH